MSRKNAAGPNPIDKKGSVFFCFVTIVPPGLDIAVVPDSMVVSAGRVGECLGAIGARVGLLAGMNILMSFEMELGREALTALRADNGANLQVDGPNMPLHQARTRLETALAPICIIPNTLGLPTTAPLDVFVGVDNRRGAGSRRGLRRLVLGGKRRRGRGSGCLRRASGRVRVVGRVAAVTGIRG